MSLPMNATPVYTLKVPSTGKELKYRPFLVKDEKALLIAQQSDDPIVMLDTIKDVIQSCAKTDIDCDKLASFDVEYIFLKLRAVSVGEIVELFFRCDTCEDEKAIAKVDINLDDVEVKTQKEHTNKIDLFGDVGICMKYPTFDVMKKLEEDTGESLDVIFDVVCNCVDYIYSAEEMFPAKDQKKEELLEFLNNLTTEQFDKIRDFFRTMPQLRVDVKYTCPVCNKEHSKYMEGLQSFF